MENEKTAQLKAFEFLCDNHVAILATVNPNNLPECAVIYYIVGGKDIYLISRENTSKIQNMLRNNKISLAIFKELPATELQIQGTASVISEPTQKAQISSVYLEVVNKNLGFRSWPPVMKLLKGGNFAFIKIAVDKFKFSDFSGQDASMTEGTATDWL